VDRGEPEVVAQRTRGPVARITKSLALVSSIVDERDSGRETAERPDAATTATANAGTGLRVTAACSAACRSSVRHLSTIASCAARCRRARMSNREIRLRRLFPTGRVSNGGLTEC
jgi:hypothetical protein